MTQQLPITDTINLTISDTSGGFSQTGYGVCNILTNEDTYDDGARTRSYTALTGVAEDWATSSDAYLMASAIFAQNPHPTTIKISTEAARVAQVQTIVFSANLITSNSIACTIDGTALTATVFATDNATTLAALATKIQATDGVSTAVSDGSHTITVTAQNAGLPVAITGVVVTLGASQATAAIATTVASHGIADDIAEIIDLDNAWYVLLWNEQTPVYVKAAISAIQSYSKQFCSATDDANLINGASTVDAAYYAKNGAFSRSHIFYHTDPTSYPDAALMGLLAAYDAGATAANYQELTGILPDSFSATALTAMQAKYAFYYGALGDRNITTEPLRTDGYYFDAVKDKDYVKSYTEENLALYVINKYQSGSKIPFTQAGIDSFEAQLRAILRYLEVTKKVITFEGIDPSLQVVFPVIGDISAADKATRTLNDVSFTCKIQGAIYKFVINGLFSS